MFTTFTEKNVFRQSRHFLFLKKINNSRADLPREWCLQKLRASRRKARWSTRSLHAAQSRAALRSPGAACPGAAAAGKLPCAVVGWGMPLLRSWPDGLFAPAALRFPSPSLADLSPSPPYLCPFLCFSFQLIPSCFSLGPFCVTYTHTLFYPGKLI